MVDLERAHVVRLATIDQLNDRSQRTGQWLSDLHRATWGICDPEKRLVCPPPPRSEGGGRRAGGVMGRVGLGGRRLAEAGGAYRTCGGRRGSSAPIRDI